MNLAGRPTRPQSGFRWAGAQRWSATPEAAGGQVSNLFTWARPTACPRATPVPFEGERHSVLPRLHGSVSVGALYIERAAFEIGSEIQRITY